MYCPPRVDHPADFGLFDATTFSREKWLRLLADRTLAEMIFKGSVLACPEHSLQLALNCAARLHLLSKIKTVVILPPAGKMKTNDVLLSTLLEVINLQHSGGFEALFASGKILLAIPQQNAKRIFITGTATNGALIEAEHPRRWPQRVLRIADRVTLDRRVGKPKTVLATQSSSLSEEIIFASGTNIGEWQTWKPRPSRRSLES
jgi:hypothetical protein